MHTAGKGIELWREATKVCNLQIEYVTEEQEEWWTNNRELIRRQLTKKHNTVQDAIQQK
jgi:hypothetical protein